MEAGLPKGALIYRNSYPAKQQLMDIALQTWNTGLGELRTFEVANKGTQNYSLDKSAISPNGLQC